jgi:hypothetical protein
MVASESVFAFNAGKATKGDNSLCPFSVVDNNSPFNTMILMGSKLDVSDISFASQVNTINIAKTQDVPLDVYYNIAGEGTGSINAYMTVNAQDARGNGTKQVVVGFNKPVCKTQKPSPVYASQTVPSSELRYTETSTAIGTWNFAKEMHAQSGVAI